MKQAPENQHLDMVLRSSALVAGGFMGDDPRGVIEVIESDAGELFRLGFTAARIARRMREITNMAAGALGTWIDVGANCQAMVDEVRGSTPCPWPHEGYYPKRVTTLQITDSGKTIRWSDLNIHMIAAHGFFEGRGSQFRLEPAKLVKALF